MGKKNLHNLITIIFSIISVFNFSLIQKKGLLKIKSIILCLTLLFNSFYILSQTNPITFDYLTTNDGLPDNRIEVLFRDSKDYLWIGTTHNGLSKFDGNDITTYEHADNKPGSISDNNINCIYEDSKNNLWIGTRNGLNLFNPKSNSFTVFKFYTPDTVYTSENFVSGILEDSNGNLWVTYNYSKIGLVKWDYINNKCSGYLIESRDDDMNTNALQSIREDSKGRLWVVSQSQGIYRFDPKTCKFKFYSDPAIDIGDKMDKCMLIDNNDKIWIGTEGNGLFSFDPSSLKFRQFGINIGNKGINHHYISVIIQPDPDHLLIGTDQGGINKLDMASETFEYIVQNDKVKHGLNNNGILSLFYDKEGILWVGTTRGGINYYNPKKHKFKLFEYNENNPNSLSYNIVGCFYEDSEGIIWIGTDGGGLNSYDPKTGKFKVFEHDPENPYSISGDVIRSITEDADKDLWIGTWDAGLNRYNRKTGKFYHYLPDKNDPVSISSTTSWNLITDHNNNLWIDDFEAGLVVFDKDKGVVKRFSADPNDPRSLSDNYIWLIYEDHQNNIWLCKPDGINLYDSTTNSFTVFNSFPDNDIRAFCRDMDGKLWAGSTNKGLFLFEMDGTVIKIFDKSNGLADNTIHAIVEDNHGNLWISTNKGISHFDQKTQKFRNYDISDGLQEGPFFQQSFLKTRNGEIYFGGNKGFNSFQPDSIKDNDYIPRVNITGFKLFNKPVPIGTTDSPLKHHISVTKEITLTWQQSVFTFEFSAINYTHPEKNEYAYIMEGFEEEWNYVGNKRDATYTNLDAGEYVFRVMASNNDGVWNKEGTSIKIIIKPPFWNTGWFRFIIVLVLAIAVYSIYLIRVSSLKNQKKALEIQVDKRTKELKLAYDNLRSISSFGQKVTSKLDYSSINEMIYNYINSFIDNFDFGIGMYVPDKHVIEYRMFYENGKLIDPYVRNMSNKNSFSVYCVENQKTVFINDLEKEYKPYMSQLPDFSYNRFPHSLVNIPLTVNQKKIGVLAINSIFKNAFSKEDLLKMNTLAAYIAIALDNAESHSALLDKNKILLERQQTIQKQSAQINETNTLLEERQQHIEEQAEELRAQAEKLMVANDDLKQSNATKDRLFSIIAHDLKNPFSPIIGFSELIIKKWDTMDNTKKKLMIESIYNSSKNIFGLLQNLLQWSRSQMGSIKYNPENISIFKLVKENAGLLSNLIEEKNISIKINVSEDLICYADYQMINAVVRNILTNAIKFTDKGTITIDSESESNIAKIAIKDSGVGMSEEKLKNLFEVEKSKSTQGTRGEQGTGLGLIICKEFITKNKGEIYATGKENIGTTVVFTLPLKPPEK